MNGLIALVFAGGFGTALMAILTAADDSRSTPIVVDDDHADVDRILGAPGTPACLIWGTFQ